MDPAVAALDFAKAGAIIANMIESYLAAGATPLNAEGAEHAEREDCRSSFGTASLHLHSPVDDGTSASQSGEHRASVQSSEPSEVARLDSGADPVLDGDLAQSGQQTTRRDDFKTLVSDVAMGQVGAIFSLESSRLARSNKDWHRLLELCAVTKTLVFDGDGCYDPSDFNDSLVLGMKGTFAQAELHIIRARLLGAKLNRAQKGELRFPLPVGLVFDGDKIVLDPDQEVQGAVRAVFTLFEQENSAYAVVQRFDQLGLLFPRRSYGGVWDGKLIWGRLTHSRVIGVLANPSYAGTYVFGRYQSCKKIGPTGEICTQSRRMPQDQWRVVIPDHHPG